MLRVLTLSLGLILACGQGDGSTEDNGFSGGDGCSGASFTLNYSGDRSGSATGDCVVSVFLDSSPIGTISAVEENEAVGGGASLILTFNQPDLTLQSGVFSDSRFGEEAACAVVDIFDGTVENAVSFTRNDDSGYDLVFDVPLECCGDGGLACDESNGFNLRVSGTLSEDRPL